MSSIEEVLHILKNYVDEICCCCSRKNGMQHRRFSTCSVIPHKTTDPQNGIVNPCLILDSTAPSSDSLGSQNDPKLSSDGELKAGIHFIERVPNHESQSTRESGYGTSIANVERMEDLCYINRTATVSESNSEFRIRVGVDGRGSWVVVRRLLEFLLLQEQLRIKIGQIGPDLLREGGHLVQDLNDFVRDIIKDPQICRSPEVVDFLNLVGSVSAASASATNASANSTPELVLNPADLIEPKASYERNSVLQKQRNSLNCDCTFLQVRNLANGDEGKNGLSPSDFEFLSVIGRGSYGKVMLARRKADNKIYAVKMLNKRMVLRRNETAHVLSERSVLTRVVHHPYIVQLHYAFTTSTKIFFVLDYANGGELFYHLQKERTFSEPRARFYVSEICCALCYMHSQGIVYRDLKPENILLDKDGHVVLTDFGLCKEGLENDTARTSTFCGTPEYLAPEIILKMPYNKCVDWWTFGTVLHEMLYGLPPFYCKDTAIMYKAIIHKPLRLKRYNASPEARDLLKQLLQKKPSERLGAGPEDGLEVKLHPFFAEIDWNLVDNKLVPPPFVPNVRGEDDLGNIDPIFTRERLTVPSRTPSGRSEVSEPDAFQGFTYIDAEQTGSNLYSD